MVTSIATAKAETLGAVEVSNSATEKQVTAALGTSNAINSAVATVQNLALAAALAEAGAVDLLKVASWAEFFGGLRSADVAPEIRGAIEGALKAYAGALRSMATKPAAGSQGMQ